MEENIFPKWLNRFTGIFFPSTESRTSKQVLPSCLEGKRSPSLGKTEPETDPTHTFWSSTACRDQSTTEQKYLLYIFPTAFVEWLIQIKEQPNPYHTQPRALCSHNSTQMGASLRSIIFLLPLNLPQGQEGTKLPFFYQILTASTAHTEIVLTK